MRISELLALIGLAWSRLLIYPAGLALVLAWLIERRRLISATPAAIPALLELSAVTLPWLGLALLPLPLAAALNRSVDILVVLALLEWPLILAVAVSLRTSQRAWAIRLITNTLNGYPPFILAILLLVQASASFDLTILAQPLPETASSTARVLFWIGAMALALVLPGLNAATLFNQPPLNPALRLGLSLRTIGLWAISTLPLMALVSAWPWLLPLPPVLLAGLIWGFQRAGRLIRFWARMMLLLDALLLLLLLWAAYAALQERLT